MFSNDYWAEKTVSWNGITAGLTIWIFAFTALLLVETVSHFTAEIQKTDDFSAQQNKSAFPHIAANKEYHLLNCRYCE